MKKIKLGEITLNIVDGVHGDCQSDNDSGFYFISVKDLDNVAINYFSARQITKDDFQKANLRTKLEVNDVLFANTGDTIGKMLRITNETAKIGYTTFQKSIAILKPDVNKIDPIYFYYLVRFNIPGLRHIATGSGQKNLLLVDMRNYEIIIRHNKEVQKQIGNFLYSLDKKILLNKKINATLEAMAKTIYMHKFFRKAANGKISDIIIENLKSTIPVGAAKNSCGEFPFF
ncbi:MAG: restriction endonuclease subunit S, partial [Selenomonadaceae bacterium]|nr:restriction endonuclease subunit S [Selenomonadaceae bacterium]